MNSQAGAPHVRPLALRLPDREATNMAQVASPASPPKAPKRYPTAKATLIIDHLMVYVITIGGIAVIIAVLGIFVFILSQILPLFQSARFEELRHVPLPTKSYQILGADEWTELPFLLTSDGSLFFVDLAGQAGVHQAELAFDQETSFTAFAYSQKRQEVVFATGDGQFSVVRLNYKATFAGNTRTIVARPLAGPFFPIGKPGYPIKQIAYADSGAYKLAVAMQEVDGRLEVHAVSLVQKRTLLGAGKIKLNDTYDLTAAIRGQPQSLAVNDQADGIVVATTEGDVDYFFREADEVTLRQVFTPFRERDNRSIASMDYLLGGVSLVFTSASGVNRIFSLYVPEGGNKRLFGQTKQFPALPGPATFYAASLRNKAFLIGSGSEMSLRYATTETIRYAQELPYTVSEALLGAKYTRVLLLDTANTLHVFKMDDPHPESGFKALFAKLWYEGSSAPRYVWQSTGGTDAFEPKLSLVPVIIGTLKGTLYAMLFAVPVALLAAIYTSQFLKPDLRIVVKPTMEIMASLPSVILGFLAALWLAPILETRVPSFLLLVLFIPISAMLFGRFWSSLPLTSRKWIGEGYEFIAFIPILIIVGYVAWHLGPVIERLFFVVIDPETGRQVADFRLWWPQVTGMSFEQRNSLVVGFIMGFAVIPIIFTLTEDALSSVPPALKSGSLALGASRWQTAVRVVLPTASAGVFSALMIGLGRAVGETMIVLMATGNTPIMDFNIFSGMRTLSANIAVELPEAPHHGTLYRTLFLGGMVLFLLTFLVNTLAEILRQHLRERYKTV
jgi:phosphate transport system permease protein